MRAFFLSFFVFALLLPFASGRAAEISLDPADAEIPSGQTIRVDVFVDTEGEDVNAMEGVLVFPNDLLELVEVRDGNSLIPFWIERPTPRPSPIPFSGIIPGGSHFPRGQLFSLDFLAKQTGVGSVELEDIRILLNDGSGTATDVASVPARISVSGTASSISPQDVLDTTPPEAFTPVLAKDPNMFEGRWFVSFLSQDKESGIDRYEIRETSVWGKGAWRRAESPEALRTQDVSRPHEVRAIDRAGNMTLATIRPLELRPPLERPAALVILLVLAAILFTPAIPRKKKI